jgi:outer membrane protein insertion porin family
VLGGKCALRIMLLSGVLLWAPQISFAQESTQNKTNVIAQIEVDGNQRISHDSILYHAGLKAGDPLTQDQLNKALKALFDTSLFEDVSINHAASTVKIHVVENPIVNRVVFEGNRRINEDSLKSEIFLKPRDVYTKNRVQADTLRVLSLYRRQGRFGATIEPKIIKLDQNRVDLVFEINEGPLTGIKKIMFIGNDAFSTSKLQSAIRTKESRWYRFLTSDDNYDPERLAYDRELLRVHYMKKGYADFKVLSSVCELAPDKSGFFVTFTVDEGKRYKFGDISLSIQLKDVDEAKVRKLLEVRKGDWFDGSQVEKTIDKVTDYLGDHGYAFVNIKPVLNKHPDEPVVDCQFEVSEGPRVFIGDIDIYGNVGTFDRVVRREFRLKEGDAYNTSMLRRSEQRLHNLNFFSTVNVEKEQGSAPDKLNLKVHVKEKSTGEISAAAGVTSLEGLIGNVRYKEINFMGRGQDLTTEFTISKITRQFDVSFTEPYFLNKNLSAGIDLVKMRYDQSSQSGFVQNRSLVTTRIGYHVTEPLIQKWWYSLREDSIGTLRDNVSKLIAQQKGTKVTSLIGHGLHYDRRDSAIDPTTGYLLSLNNEYAGLGGQVKFFKHQGEAKGYVPLSEKVVFSLRSTAGLIQMIDKNPVRIIDRFFLGGESLRGFEYFGVTPRDKTQDAEAMGGRYFYTGSAELAFPLGLPNELGIKGCLFSDVGSSWQSDQSSALVNDSKKPRVSAGFGIAWTSPLGPLRLDFAKALRYEKFDKRQVVLFSFRTTF